MRKCIPKKNEYYHNDIEYLEDQFRLIDLLEDMKQIHNEKNHSEKLLVLAELERQISYKKQEIQQKKVISEQHHHKAFQLEKIISEYQLDDFERKILVFLLYRYFSTDNESTTGRTILEHITENRLSMMQSRHYLMEEGRLRRNDLIQIEMELEDERTVLDLEFTLPEEVISQVLAEKNNQNTSISKEETEKTYKNYLKLHFTLVDLLESKSEVLSMLRHDPMSPMGFLEMTTTPRDSSRELSHIRHSIRKTKNAIDEFGEVKETYPLEKIVKEYQLNQEEKLILVVLLQHSLLFSDYGSGCEGKKLLAIISDSENEMIAKRPLLYQENKLRRHNLVDVEKGWSGQNILEGEYFLSEKVIRQLLDDERKESLHLAEEEYHNDEEGQNLSVITPRFSFEDVILSNQKKQAIEIALSQQKYHSLIFETWGFAKKIPYGNSLTMLFSGPPGTGKTMMAEAIAQNLGKKLLVANYAQIQNMYVGETEKRIVATFKRAKELEGVLLWDEADAMFYSRDMASHSWEYRDVNVILQELERFQGVVILTTNRTVSLDQALERRISLKVTFELPGVEQRKQIWKSLIPTEAPLSPNVDVSYLAEKYEVAGGTIKNAILHAARYAAYNKSFLITQEDLEQGIKMETEASWTTYTKIGFQK